MTNEERITALEAEVKALRELVEHITTGGRVAMGTTGKMIPVAHSHWPMGPYGPRPTTTSFQHNWAVVDPIKYKTP